MASASAITAPRERPILFSASMVNAMLDERKTQTRRIVKPQPVMERIESFGPSWAWHRTSSDWFSGVTEKQLRAAYGLAKRCPYGAPGDRLWVKETWKAGKSLDPYSPSKIRQMARSAGYRDAWGPILYTADRYARSVNLLPDFGGDFGKTRVSIHMPRWASRITLEVTGVRVERLQDITEEDAKAEGVPTYPSAGGTTTWYKAGESHFTDEAKLGFRFLWETINGAGSWHANPWVWVVEFRRLHGHA